MGLFIEFASELIAYTWDYFSENYKIVREYEDFGRSGDLAGMGRYQAEGEYTAVFRGKHLHTAENNPMPMRSYGASRFVEQVLERLQQDELSDLAEFTLENRLRTHSQELVDHALSIPDITERLATIYIPARFLGNAYYTLTNRRVESSRVRAICAWEAVCCLEQGWSRGRFHSSTRLDLKAKAVTWLDSGLRSDSVYTRQRFNYSQRREALLQMLQESPILLQSLSDDHIHIEDFDWSEVTPTPARARRAGAQQTVSPSFSYDRNNLFDSTHHQLVAQDYERSGEWQRAVEVWRRIVWLDPRKRHRSSLARALEKAALQDPSNAAQYLREAQQERNLIQIHFRTDA